MRIVDDQGQRPLFGQPRAEPVKAVESCEQAIVRGRSVGNLLEQRARQSRGAREGPFTLAVRERLDARGQQLDHDAERELALQHAAARAQDRHLLRLGQLRGRSEQRALADPGRSLDQHDPPRAGRGDAQRTADLRQLGLTLQQGGSALEIRHPAPPEPSLSPEEKPAVGPRSEARSGRP